MQKTKLRYLKQMFYLHLVNLILAQYSTKSAPFNGHYPKWQYSTYIWFPYAQSPYNGLCLSFFSVAV